jgi:prophage regulatory protein
MIMKQISRLQDVIDQTKLSGSTIYSKINDGTFPPPVKLSTRAVGWVSSEIDEWIDERIKTSRLNQGDSN